MRTLAVLLSLALLSTASPAQPDAVAKQLDELGRSLAQKPCSSPIKREVQIERNRHDPAVQDAIITVRCAGLVAKTYQANSTKPPVILPYSVHLSAANSQLPSSLQVGALVSGLSTTLGPARRQTGNILFYPLSAERPEEDTVAFTHGSGRITAIQWVWAVD